MRPPAISNQDRYRRNPARDIEKYAVRVVASWVGESGTVIDMSEGPEPDFRIEYRDGRVAIGEVGWHEDRVLREMWSNAFRREHHQVIQLPAGYGKWVVELDAGANIGQLYRELPVLLSEFGHAGLDSFGVYVGWPPGPVGRRARSLRITHVSRLEGNDADIAYFFMPGSGGTVPTDPNEIADWIEAVLGHVDYQDTTQKLLVREADERHVFLMSGSATPFGVGELLRRAEHGLPTRSPGAPAGITHLWAISQFENSGAVLWSPGGWGFVPAPPQT